MEQVAPREVFNAARISEKTQTFEQAAGIVRLISGVERSIEQTIGSFGDLSSFGSFRQTFFQRFRPKHAQFFIRPFLPPKIAVDVRFNELFTNVETYIDEKGAQKGHSFVKTRESLEDFAREAEHYGTKYSIAFLAGVGRKLLNLIIADYENSPYAKPGEVEVVGTEKRYPFSELGAEFNVAFIIRNKGPGQVSELQFELLDVSGMFLKTSKVFLGDMAPEERHIEIPARVVKSFGDVLAVGRVSWRQFDGSSRSEDVMIPLSSQKSDLEWAVLSREEPYALEPVSDTHQLIGRRSTLDQLMAQARSNSVISSIVIGQKRVGKTSIVKTFQSTAEKEIPDTSVIYLESGDYINPAADKTVAELGGCICNAILAKCPRLAGIGIPEFKDSLSPLVRFLAAASGVLPEHKFVFILDEFDELPLSLYKRSEIGDALFLTIRSISGKNPYGFILVGSEKLARILSYQGERLNKFSELDIDYFDQQREWNNYCELVRKPVDGWLDIEDGAIVHVYKQSAGNPFFTKLICRELFKLMVSRRDRHVTVREMEEATMIAVNTASSVNFQHFWDDGIFESGNKKEEISLRRRKMLMAFADSVRPDGDVGRNDLRNIAGLYGVDGVVFDEYLPEFQARHVWLVHEGFVSCKVPFFSRWLKQSGVKSIITTILDPEAAILARRQSEEFRVTSGEIVEVVQKWSVYKGSPITEERVRAWLDQFGSDLRKQRLMFRLLQHMKFYNGAAIRAKMREAYARIGSGAVISRDKQKRSDILISYVDAAGKSGVYYARTFADENGIYFDNIVEPSSIIGRIRNGGIQTLLFVDDVLGGGTTAAKGLKKLLPSIRDELKGSGVKVAFFAICGFGKAKSVVEKAAAECGCEVRVLVGDILTESDRAFSIENPLWRESVDRDDAKTLAFEKGKELEPRCPLGFDDCEALLAFESSCPNNALPILWSRAKKWIALFPRN